MIACDAAKVLDLCNPAISHVCRQSPNISLRTGQLNFNFILPNLSPQFFDSDDRS
jgi:hypothetical protein